MYVCLIITSSSVLALQGAPMPFMFVPVPNVLPGDAIALTSAVLGDPATNWERPLNAQEGQVLHWTMRTWVWDGEWLEVYVVYEVRAILAYRAVPDDYEVPQDARPADPNRRGGQPSAGHGGRMAHESGPGR